MIYNYFIVIEARNMRVGTVLKFYNEKPDEDDLLHQSSVYAENEGIGQIHGYTIHYDMDMYYITHEDEK